MLRAVLCMGHMFQKMSIKVYANKSRWKLRALLKIFHTPLLFVHSLKKWKTSSLSKFSLNRRWFCCNTFVNADFYWSLFFSPSLFSLSICFITNSVKSFSERLLSDERETHAEWSTTENSCGSFCILITLDIPDEGRQWMKNLFYFWETFVNCVT